MYVDCAVTNSSTLSPSPTPDETANWETYKNTIYGFQLDYPSNWVINETDDSISIENNGTRLTFYSHTNPDSGKFDVSVIKIEPIKVGDETITFNYYTSTVTKQMSAYAELSTTTQIGKKFRNINFYLKEEIETNDLNIIRQILSTFKFLD